MRLTDKKPCLYPCDTKTQMKIVDKLWRLENLEEELGIDFITLFKALKNGIYVKTKKYNGFVESYNIRLASELLFKFSSNPPRCEREITGVKIIFGKTGRVIYGREYGKTWALTKEELL